MSFMANDEMVNSMGERVKLIDTPDSSNIKRFGFVGQSETKGMLTVEFKDDSVYDYFDVPHTVFEALKDSIPISVGKKFTAVVRGIYRYERKPVTKERFIKK